jgi:hypothetical protein
MRPLLLVALAVSMPPLGYDSGRSATHVLQQEPGPPRTVVLVRPVTVPLQPLRPGDPRPAVEAIVDGKGPFRFLVETGSNSIDLSSRLIDSLHLRRNGGSDSAPTYHLDRITIGGAGFEDMTVSLAPTAVGSVDGVLGLPFFANVLLTIDYPAQMLRLDRDSVPDPDGQDILAIRRDVFWELPISLAGHDTIAILDTQNSGAISVPPSLADLLPFDSALAVVGRARGAFGEIEVRGGRLRGPLMIGRYSFPRPFVRVVPLPPDYPRQVNLGSGLLRNFAVTLDQVRGRLRLARQGSLVIALPEPARRPASVSGASAPVAQETTAPTTSARLEEYAGTYGDRVLTVEAGALVLTRPHGHPNLLHALNPDVFSVEGFPDSRVEFVRDSTRHVVAVRVLNAEGHWEEALRRGP